MRDDSSFYLVVKEHTRSGTGDLPEQFADQLRFECASTDTSSVALIKWADVVINCNTSVGIDVLLDGKVHLIPRYIQNKRTIFEETNSGLFPRNLKELVRMLKEIRNYGQFKHNQKSIESLSEIVVYAGAQTDVLKRYVTFLKGVAHLNESKQTKSNSLDCYINH